MISPKCWNACLHHRSAKLSTELRTTGMIVAVFLFTACCLVSMLTRSIWCSGLCLLDAAWMMRSRLRPFFRSWVPTYKDWDENRAAHLLASVWRPGQHDMGMGPRMLPQHHEGAAPSQAMGLRLMTRAANRLASGPEVPKTSTGCLALVRDILGTKKGFASVVIARDLGILRVLFHDEQCYEVGENGFNGPEPSCPKSGLEGVEFFDFGAPRTRARLWRSTAGHASQNCAAILHAIGLGLWLCWRLVPRCAAPGARKNKR